MSLENGYSTAQEPTTKIEQKKQQSEQKNTIETPIPTEQSSEQLENNKKLNELKNKFPLLSEIHLNQNQISTLIFLQEKLQNLDIQNPDNEEIVTDLQKLNQILQNPTLDLTNRKNQLNILLAKLQPIADKAIFDELRSSLDQQRVDQKKNLFLAKFNLQSQGQLLEEKGKQVGRLTLEAFLDDALSDPNFITNSNTITELYSSREDRQIDTFSKINAEKFKSALISASNNAEDFKKPAQIAILKIQNDPSLSSEQKQHLISAENQKWITAAKEANGMLNRQELVIAALSNYNPPRNEAEYIKKLQIIGQEYFNNKLISIDGHWGPQTQTVVEKLLEDFKINPRFEQIAANLQRILKTHRKHNTEKVKTTFAFKMEANIFDTHQINDSLNAKNKENPLLKQNKENKNQKADSIAHSPSNSDEAKKQLSEHSFQNISETTLESSIPKDQESKAIQSFLAKVAQQFEQNGNEYLETEEFHKLGPKAIETAIRNGDISTPLLESLHQSWQNSQERAQLLSSHKSILTDALRATAAEAVLHTGENFLAKFGIQVLSRTEVKEPNGRYYFELKGNNGMNYYYRPETGNISTKSFDKIDHQNQSLQLGNHSGYRIIHHIPKFDELVQKAQNLNFLQGERPDTLQNLAKNIKNGIQSEISHTIGELEQNAVDTIIKNEQSKSQLSQEVSTLFGAKAEIITSQTENPALYEAIRPLINSMPEASTPDLLQLQKLTKTLKDNHELAKNGQQKTNANPENMTSLSQLQLQTPKDLFALIANPHEMTQLSDPTKQDKKADGTPQFSSGFQAFMKRLEKGIAGKSNEFNTINIAKLKPLLDNPDDPNILQKPEYRGLTDTIKQIYPKRIENRAKLLDNQEISQLEQQIQTL